MDKGQKVAVIGGGAAGFFAALSAAHHHPMSKVTLFEKSNKLLAKVKVSGGGRCNVTHACFSPRRAGQRVSPGRKTTQEGLFRISRKGYRRMVH